MAELLIALAILGLIAAFAIPKVLATQQQSKLRAIAKETAATLSGAFQQYKTHYTVTTATGIADLIPYINYVKLDTSSSVDYAPLNGPGTYPCDASNPCLRLHNGAFVVRKATV